MQYDLRVVKRNQQSRVGARSLRATEGWTRIVGLVALACAAAPPLAAQNCTASSPQLAVVVLQNVLATCSKYDDFRAIEYKYGHDVILVQASVAGNLAIPVLRQFASLPKHNTCTASSFDAADRTALAKLGDENAYATMYLIVAKGCSTVDRRNRIASGVTLSCIRFNASSYRWRAKPRLGAWVQRGLSEQNRSRTLTRYTWCIGFCDWCACATGSCCLDKYTNRSQVHSESLRDQIECRLLDC